MLVQTDEDAENYINDIGGCEIIKKGLINWIGKKLIKKNFFFVRFVRFTYVNMILRKFMHTRK